MLVDRTGYHQVCVWALAIAACFQANCAVEMQSGAYAGAVEMQSGAYAGGGHQVCVCALAIATASKPIVQLNCRWRAEDCKMLRSEHA